MSRRKHSHRRRRRPSSGFAPQPLGMPTHPRVQQYLDAIGITRRRFVDDFEAFLVEQYAAAGAAFLDLSRGRADATQEEPDYPQLVKRLYRAKNASWDLSRDVTSQYAGRQYANYLSLFVMAKEPPTATRILDIGCDNGIATCFYASQFPNAEVVGIDRCAEGIACAKHVACMLGLKNVTFIHGDAFQSELESRYAEACDLVAMTLSGYEALEDPRLNNATLASFLHRLVSPKGTLIVMEPRMTELFQEIDKQFAEQILVNLFFEDGGGNEIRAGVMFAHKQKLGRDLVVHDG
jgi:ubiquinone/menaquinone biosynthesis C-methylase UbiE